MSTGYFYPSSDDQLRRINESLGEDEGKLKTKVNLFKEWLKFEDYLPREPDERVIETYVRQCKFDLNKAKRKFASSMVFKARHPHLYTHEGVCEAVANGFHRNFVLLKIATEDGGRIGYLGFKTTVRSKDDMLSIMRYGAFAIEYMMCVDKFSNYTGIVDLRGVDAGLVQHIDVGLVLKVVNAFLNYNPIRVKNLHIINMSQWLMFLYKLVLKIASEKIAKRIILHENLNTLYEYVPKDLLPEELGGSTDTLDRIAEDLTAFHDDEFRRCSNSFALAGEVPKGKHDGVMYDEMDGSFRQLQID